MFLGGWAGSIRDLQPGPVGWDALLFNAADGGDACALAEIGESTTAGKKRRWVAFSRACPHAGIDLISADVEDMGSRFVIACPAHTYLWDATTGSCLWDTSRIPPTTPSLRTFEVDEESGGDIWVQPIPPPPAPTDATWDRGVADKLQMEIVNRALARKFPDDD